MWKKYQQQGKKRSYDAASSNHGFGDDNHNRWQFKSLDDLKQLLLSLNGKSYGAYKSLTNFVFQGPLFDIMCTRVQSDPFAGPSTFSVYIHPEQTLYPPELYLNSIRTVALADYIGRIIEKHLDLAPKDGGRSDYSVKGGTFTICKHPQQVLERGDVVVYEGGVDFRFKLSLPARGRNIVPFKALYALLDYLPSFIERHLLASVLDLDDVMNFVICIEDQEWIRSRLHDQGLVAFVPDGAILSRAAGDTDTPNLDSEKVVAFQSPESLMVYMSLPSGKHLQGMGIPRGITVITGGGYHGKSTLLRALEMGVYNHIPGDGREYLAVERSTIKVRSEDGRWIKGVNISPFIKNLPFGTDTMSFSTTNASGSTSMAASIQEMVEGESKLILYDEDTCATNFLVSDLRMRQLVNQDHEPIIPLTSRIRQLYKDKGVSSIMVTGACFDFLELADLVIEMRNYAASDVTTEAKKIAKSHHSLSSLDNGKGCLLGYGQITSRRLKFPNYMNDCKVIVEKHGHITFKDHSELVMNMNELLVEQPMTRSIKCGLFYLLQQSQCGQQPLTVLENATLLDQLMDRAITKTPLDDLGKDKRCFLESPLDKLYMASPFGQDICDLSRPPKSALIYALNRLRGTELIKF